MAKDKGTIKGRTLNFDKATTSSSREKSLKAERLNPSSQPKGRDVPMEALDQMMQKWMNMYVNLMSEMWMQAYSLKEVVQEVHGKMTIMGNDLCKLEQESGAIGHAIDTKAQNLMYTQIC